MLKAALLLALALAASPLHAASSSPAELVNNAIGILTQTDAVRYTVIASDKEDLRTSNYILRGSVLADLSPDAGVVAAKVDVKVTGDDIPRGARLVLTAGPDGAQLLNYAAKAEIRVDFADINSSDAAAMAKLYGWLNDFIKTDDKPLYTDDGSARVRGTERIGREACDVISAKLGNQQIEFYMSQTTGLPVRIDTVDSDGETQFIRINGMRTDVKAPASLFNIKPAPRGFTLASSTRNKPADEPSADAPMFGSNVGDLAPVWTLFDAKNKRHTLADYKGKVVLLDFWSTECGPCKAAMPSLQRMQREYSAKGLTVIGVNVNEENPQDAVKYMRSHALNYLLLLQGDPLLRLYAVNGYPAFFLINREGTIVAKGTDYSVVGELRLENAIRAELGLPEKALTIDNINDDNIDDWDG